MKVGAGEAEQDADIVFIQQHGIDQDATRSMPQGKRYWNQLRIRINASDEVCPHTPVKNIADYIDPVDDAESSKILQVTFNFGSHLGCVAGRILIGCHQGKVR
jgi:hypothetical protein